MPERDALIRQFLAGQGFGVACRLPLAGDASVRRYERLEGGPRPAVLMDAPPGQIELAPFLRAGRWLRGLGLSAPAVIAADPETGLALLEDLGDDLLNRVLAAGGDEPSLYVATVDLLVELQGATPPDGLPLYDEAKMLTEASLLVEWYAPPLADDAKSEYLALWREVLPAARVGEDAFVYVDYHADNLLWLPARKSLARIGLLDFQDARIGPPAYDLVSLLEDARRDVGQNLAGAMIEHYLTARPELDADAFRAAYAVLGAQRNAKILGLFTRLARRDGKPRYLDPLPRVLGYLRGDLRHPVLAPLRVWFERHLQLKVEN
jgi:N-acetylmuramate 1-kinase